MTLTRDELLVLLLYTSPKTRNGNPVIFASTRVQKLMFLLTQGSEVIRKVCAEPYEFVPYDFGPYSGDLDRDLRDYSDPTWSETRQSEALAKAPEDLSFEYLTSFMRNRPGRAEAYILRGPGVARATTVLHRLEQEGIDTAQLLKEFRDTHMRYGALGLDDLLRFVYARYPSMATNTKRPDLLLADEEEGWNDEGDEDELDA